MDNSKNTSKSLLLNYVVEMSNAVSDGSLQWEGEIWR